MPRNRRLHLPAAGFHVTARTQDGAQYFLPEMREDIATDIKEAMLSFGHRLLAYVIMPNHFHIVLKQGSTPLGWAMQRIMQRTVMRVRRHHGGEGHVFGRPYWSCVCPNAIYLRRAIVYTHMNPCKARICDHPSQYSWSSHNNYVAAVNRAKSNAWDGLLLFADTSLEASDVVANYQRFIDYCIERRKSAVPGDWLLPEGPNRALIPSAAHGDSHWAATYSMFAEAEFFTRVNIDVTSRATSLLERLAPDLDLDSIRLAGRSRNLGRIRRNLIAALITAGCGKSAIARSLRVSPALVSKIAADIRFPAAREKCSTGRGTGTGDYNLSSQV